MIGLSSALSSSTRVALLTGGGDKPYALGLASSLANAGSVIDFIGSDFLEAPELLANPSVHFLNLRGDVDADAPVRKKAGRVARYYARLLRYAIKAEPRIFHILWNNRLEVFDRTFLMLWYRCFGRLVVLTVHNVNARERDGGDGILNRFTLKMQYRLAKHLFVHTERMKLQLQDEFGVAEMKISVIPFGVNDTVPLTNIAPHAARTRLGLDESHKIVLFFGNIAPYKGLGLLVEAMSRVSKALPESRLVIAGRPKGTESHWETIERRIVELKLSDVTIKRIDYVPDEETEIYFKASDLLVLPYTHVYQSGVLFLGYNFGLPVVATDVGALKDDIVEGETGFVCPPGDPAPLADAIQRYFASELYRSLARLRPGIRRWAIERHSWATVATMTNDVYRRLVSA